MRSRDALILWILVLLLCGSCTAGYHAKQAKKHADKAENKQPGIIKNQEVVDTITFTKIVTDTIHTSDSTFYIETRELHYDTIIKIQYQQYDFSEFKTWFQIQQEEKTKRKLIKEKRKENQTEIRQREKTERTQIRNDRKEKKGRSWWWLWMILGAGLVICLRILYGRVKPFINANNKST